MYNLRSREGSEDLLHHGEVLPVVVGLEQREPQVQLEHDAAWQQREAGINKQAKTLLQYTVLNSWKAVPFLINNDKVRHVSHFSFNFANCDGGNTQFSKYSEIITERMTGR